MKINELQAKQADVTVEGTITEVSQPREFQKYGKPGKVANSILSDDTGTVTLTLWNEDADTYKAGDKIRLSNGFVNEWQGDLQLSAGRNGKIEKIE